MPASAAPSTKELLTAAEKWVRQSEQTPLQRLTIPDGPEVWVKRKDLSPTGNYHWRGAVHRIESMESRRGVVAASLGEHGMAVAWAAHRAGVPARVHVPVGLPVATRRAMRRLGRENLELKFFAGSLEEASRDAHIETYKDGRLFVPAWDWGDGASGFETLADETYHCPGAPFDAAYLPAGGGRFAGAVGLRLREYSPRIRVIAVEAEPGGALGAALSRQEVVSIDPKDPKCDEMAVRRVENEALRRCGEAEVSVEQVGPAEQREAARVLWEELRCGAGPVGSLGMAAILKDRAALAGKRVLTVVGDAALEPPGFEQQRTFFRLRLPARFEALRELLESEPWRSARITSVHSRNRGPAERWAVVGVELEHDRERAALVAAAEQHGFSIMELSTEEAVFF